MPSGTRTHKFLGLSKASLPFLIPARIGADEQNRTAVSCMASKCRKPLDDIRENLVRLVGLEPTMLLKPLDFKSSEFTIPLQTHISSCLKQAEYVAEFLVR